MVELSGIQQAIQRIAEQTAKDQARQGTPDKGVAAVDDVQRLQAALNQPAPQPDPATMADGTPMVEKVGEVARTDAPTPGARLLDSMHSMRTEFKDTMENIAVAMAKPGGATSADILKMQFDLQQLSLKQDLLGKVVSKSEQNVETLLKGQ